MSKYEFTPKMHEISGFGGGYEARCREMLKAGMEWMDAHPGAEPRFKGIKGVFGLVTEGNADAKGLSDAIMEPETDCSGAMHHAVGQHCLVIIKNGWDWYVFEMEKPRESKAS